ncbi:DNA excision repair protein ERCC-6-like 2 [Microdochium nivale]|nr:DNA excision repair protein ERCC-6-like 2 [Microdochium nivale]
MSTTGTITISDDDDGDTAPARRVVAAPSTKRKRHSEPVLKIEWSDESEGNWEAFTKRKKGKVPRKVPVDKKGKGKAVARSASVRTSRKDKNGRAANDDSLSEDDILEQALPEYVRIRRRDFDQGFRDRRTAGLRLPPSYEGIDFSDDEHPGKLEVKPQFDKRSGIKPSHEYKDVVLEHSAGTIPAPIAQYLRDYQIEGVRFLHHLFVYQRGGILGDDMGLGKTVQVAAFLTAAFGKSGDIRDAKRMRKFRRSRDDWYPRALIICPGSLTQNWKNELNRWGWWATDLYHGPDKDGVLGSARAGRLEVMITTYGTYKNHCDQINRVQWDVVIADECHAIKEITAGITVAMNQINALCRIGLTGTAIQNKYEEFWTLLNWTNPGQFGTIEEWKRSISRPLTVGQSHDATVHQLREARDVADKLVKNLLPRFFLRRMKSLIAHQLPKKSDRVVFCPLSDLQRTSYEKLLESPIVEFVRSAFKPCRCGSGAKAGWCCHATREGESWKALVFPIIMALQKLSSHFSLLIPQHVDMADKQRRELRFLEAAQPERWGEFVKSRESLLYLANPEFCGKWKVLRRLLKFWHEAGDKVLVFSHSVRLLRILQYLFNNTSYSVSYLDGSLSYEERQLTVDDFNSDPNQFVFLISTKAGGVGLNITSANKVVIMDPHWNPAHDLQAQDRAYRIGQTRDVDVFRLISIGTIEEITYARQIYKQQQANIGYSASNERRYFKGVQQDSERKGEIFGIENLLSYHGDQVVLRDIVNKTNVAEARAGVHLVNINMEDAAKEEDGTQVKEEANLDDTGGLKLLSNMITSSETKGLVPESAATKESDGVRAILAAAGVGYTHENSEIVGSSKIEDGLSRRAQLATSQDVEDDRLLFLDGQNAGSKKFECEYNPPEDVCQRQFCTMAQTFGFASATEFALAVESMTQEQRRNTLESFYENRMEVLKQLGALKTEKKVEAKGEGILKKLEADDGGAKLETDISPAKDEPEQNMNLDDIELYVPAAQQTVLVKKDEDTKAKVKIEATELPESSKPAIVWLSDDEGDDEL